MITSNLLLLLLLACLTGILHIVERIACDDRMREKATALGEFAGYVYRQPSAEGELFTDYIKRVTSYSFLTEMGSL